jgi:hypothetical protein
MAATFQASNPSTGVDQAPELASLAPGGVGVSTTGAGGGGEDRDAFASCAKDDESGASPGTSSTRSSIVSAEPDGQGRSGDEGWPALTPAGLHACPVPGQRRAGRHSNKLAGLQGLVQGGR